MLTPICLFSFNRLFETQQTVMALKQNFLARESDLYIFSDGARNEQERLKVNAIRKYLKTIDGFKSVTIFESEGNKGLANSIISGVCRILKTHEKVIILEDDLITTPNFLDFMNQALDYYQEEKRVQSISGYSLSLQDKSKSVYFQTRPGSWGWATWKDRWDPDIFNKVELRKAIQADPAVLKRFKKSCGNDIASMLMGSINNKNDSWYVRWAFDHFRKEHYTVFPAYSFVQNIGFNPEGTHCNGINPYISIPADGQLRNFNLESLQVPDQKTNRKFLSYFSKKHKIIVRIRLLKTAAGRSLLWVELKMRTGWNNQITLYF
jgi:GR25 family glycosyltransferase involved in LPS biosynthesis